TGDLCRHSHGRGASRLWRGARRVYRRRRSGRLHYRWHRDDGAAANAGRRHPRDATLAGHRPVVRTLAKSADPHGDAREMIEIAALTKQFAGAPRAAVDHLTLRIPEGEVCVLIGPSGCGKTTTMRI